LYALLAATSAIIRGARSICIFVSAVPAAPATAADESRTKARSTPLLLPETTTVGCPGTRLGNANADTEFLLPSPAPAAAAAAAVAAAALTTIGAADPSH
jgi:hypothetical protein